MADFSEEIKQVIWAAAHETPAVEIRAFVQPPGSPGPVVSGIDSLLTSPSVLEEFFRRRAMGRRETMPEAEAGTARETYIKSLTPGELADIVWRQLFVDHPPMSEAIRVVLTTLGLFGLDVGSGDLRILREQFAAIPEEERLKKVLKLANLELILYPVESLSVEEEGQTAKRPPVFRPVLCLNRLLGEWKESARKLRGQGFGVKGKIDEFAPLEVRRHLAGEAARLAPVAMSFDWQRGQYPLDDGVGRLIREAVLPLCRERGLPFLVAAGIDVPDLAPLWEDNPDVRFLLFPTREEQSFAAGKAAAHSRNLLLCGPDKILSHPSCLERVIRRRLEASGSTFHACHSGAETLEELVGRWAHLRWTLGETLITRYAELWRTGWKFSEEDIRSDVKAILGGNARMFMGL